MLSEKTQYYLDKTLEQARRNGEQIWGFCLTVDEQSQEGEVGRFSSMEVSDDRFVEIVSSAASLLIGGEAAQA